MPIQVLAPEVAVQIAAGEVIERPASVVKELVENSLDAGASVVQVLVRGGGIEFIQVTDNGQGIPADELQLALQRHATSKLQNIADLDRLSTLGFRGEALPSIAAVAHVSVLSRTAEAAAGTLLEVQGGEVLRHQRRAAPVGTTVTVRRLFSQLPARRKFLKSVAAETARIHEVLAHLALAFPSVRLTLDVEGRPLLASPGTGKLRDALAAVHGAEVAQQLLPLAAPSEGEQGPLRLEGFISPIHLSRPTRADIALFVNRRWVQSRSLAFAVTEAYRGFLPERRYPLAALHLAVSPGEMDVNVHPAKIEVRFRREGEVFAFLQRSVRSTLLAATPVPPLGTAARSNFPPGSARPSLSTSQVDQALGLIPPSRGPTGEPSPATQPFDTTLPLLRVLGQLQTTYIVAEGPDGMYLIDQHAAHERVLFEELQQGAASPLRQRQGLLEPMPVTLTAEEEEVLAGAASLLEAYSFVLEPFGPGSWLIRAVPAALKEADPAAALRESLAALRQGGGAGDSADRVAASVACHGAVRAGQVLQPGQMEAMVRQLERTHQPQTCPHGRPTTMHLSASHLDRQFARR